MEFVTQFVIKGKTKDCEVEAENELRSRIANYQPNIRTEDILKIPTDKQGHMNLTVFQEKYVDTAVIEFNRKENSIHIIGDKDIVYSIKQHIQKELGIKNRGKRVLYTEEDEASVSASTSQLSYFNTAVSMKPTLRKSDAVSFQYRKTGVTVHVLVFNITKLHVDAIVNAANDRLVHAGGVAKAIADAAGPRLKDACKAYVKKHGIIPVSQNAVSPPGNLPCKKAVIHAVGPQMRDYKQAKRCYDVLCKTFMNCLQAANDIRFTSVAIPAISAGKLLAV
jgi:O-acetyl-ADP-ribose deacetylase (regulator of RNase III)